MQKFAELILKFRLSIIVVTIVSTFFFGYFLKDLGIDVDFRGYLDEDEPSVMLLTRVMDEFGIYTMAIVALETNGSDTTPNVFNYYTLKRVDEITRRLEEIDGIASVMSLTNIIDVRRTEKGLEQVRIIDIDNLPQDSEEFRNLKESVLADDLLRGLMVSEDASTTLITVAVGDIDLISAGRQIKEIVHNTTGDEKIHFSGGPFLILFSTELVLSNLRKLIPLAIIVSAAVLYISFKSLYGVSLPLITVLISAIQTLGMMGLAGSPLTLISTIMPIILIAIGSAYGVHIVSKYKEDVCSEENKIQEIKNALSKVSIPILLAGITTSIGFFSFLTAEMWVVREFGFFTGIGAMLATGISLSFLPACLSFVKVREVRHREGYSKDTRITRAIEKVGEHTLRNKNFLIAGCVIFAVVGLLSIPRLRWETNLIEFFEEETPLRKTEEMMMDKFGGGAFYIKLLVEGDVRAPLVLREMQRLQEYLELQGNINHPFSIADLIQRVYGRMLGRYTIPETREEIDFLWGFLEKHPMFSHMVNKDATAALIMLRLGTTDRREAIEVIEAINRYLEEELRTDLIRVEIATAPSELVEVLKQNRIERILARISWEAKKKGVDVPHEDVRELIAISTAEAIKGRFDHNAGEMLRAKFREYLAEETNLSEETIAAIADEIAVALTIRTPGHEELVAIIRKNAPQLYAQDPDAVEWAAEDILEIIDIDGEWARVNYLVEEIALLLPGFNRETLRGKLWEINEDLAGIEMKYADFAELDDVRNRVRLTVSHAGMHIVMLEYDRILVRSLVESLLIAVFLIFAISALRLKSLIGGLISLSTIFFTLLINFIVIIIFNMPVDVITVLTASIIVGIGIDYTIHFTSRFKFELARTKSEPIALSNTWTTTGKAIVINAFSVGAGFLVLVLADIVPMQRLGYLLALSMVVASSSSMTLLPVLIVATRLRFIGPLEQIAEELILRAREDFKKGKEIMELEIKKRREVIASEIRKRLNK